MDRGNIVLCVIHSYKPVIISDIILNLDPIANNMLPFVLFTDVCLITLRSILSIIMYAFFDNYTQLVFAVPIFKNIKFPTGFYMCSM